MKNESNLKADYFLLCDYAMLSQNNKLSIIGIFDRVFAAKLPAQHQKMVIVVTITGKPYSKHELQIIVKNPFDSEVLPTGPARISVMVGENGKANIIFELLNVVLKDYGAYKIQLMDGDTIISQATFSVERPNANASSGKVPN
jgi:hypothetical protein